MGEWLLWIIAGIIVLPMPLAILVAMGIIAWKHPKMLLVWIGWLLAAIGVVALIATISPDVAAWTVIIAAGWIMCFSVWSLGQTE